jgi:hypothetical protein
MNEMVVSSSRTDFLGINEIGSIEIPNLCKEEFQRLIHVCKEWE